jgi:hypothetical protein
MKSEQTYPLNARQDSLNLEIGINRDPIDTTISIENTKCFLFAHGSVLLDSVHEGRPKVNNGSVSLKSMQSAINADGNKLSCSNDCHIL